MANHEVTFKCTNCGLNYDARLYGSVCPVCKTVNSTPAYSHGEQNNGLFHISDAALIGANFVKSEYYDRDLSDFDNVKVVTFTRNIAVNLKIEVCFYYSAEFPGNFCLKESSTQLLLGDEDLQLNLIDLQSILKFADNLTKTIKRLTHDNSNH